jgi:hypothetical protein
MDIRIGRTIEVSAVGEQTTRPDGALEARVLAVREPRRHAGRRPPNAPERRDAKKDLDPPGARVLLLLVPEGAKVPADLDAGRYRVFVRFAKR